MSRVKLSEYRSKTLLYSLSKKTYDGLSVDLGKDLKTQLEKVSYDSYVVKVDQAIKKRNKLGLVFVKRTKTQALNDLFELQKKGYDWAIVERFVEHKQSHEHFIAISRESDGIHLVYSKKGGVDIEANKDSLVESVFDHFVFNKKQNKTSLSSTIVEKLYELFQSAHMTYLEINPALIDSNELQPLDAAVEVDSSAKFFVNNMWDSVDIRSANKKSPAEKRIEELDDKSPASFNLKLLDKDASVFLLLSGGGASVVVADEFASQGLHNKIANYGEYSGNPNEEETYTYTKELARLLTQSKASKKILVIGGGTANFTDVAKTFKGVIRALNEVKETLAEQQVSVFVRRGGPNHVIGLEAIKKFLDDANLKNIVCGPEEAIASLVRTAAKELQIV